MAGLLHKAGTQRWDEARALRDNARKVIAEMQGRYAEQTGISALKIKIQQCAWLFYRCDGAPC